MNSRITAKERNLLKACLRRVFSRSETRKAALERVLIQHSDPLRPRVTKWGFCENETCGIIEAAYQLEVDHQEPIIELNKSLMDYELDELANRVWCDPKNLKVLCPDCHHEKTQGENKERRRLKKERGLK